MFYLELDLSGFKGRPYLCILVDRRHPDTGYAYSLYAAMPHSQELLLTA